MKVLVSVQNENEMEKLNPLVDGFCLGYSKWTGYCSACFSYDQIKRLSATYKIYLMINSLIHQDKLKEFEEEVKQLLLLPINFMVSDLGAINIFKKLHASERVIYQPETMITNYLDAISYSDDNLLGLGLSNEITTKDVKIISQKINNSFYLGFGYHPMYRSYRKILSLYNKHSGLNFSLDHLSLQEMTRKDFYPVIENKEESTVFRGGVISTLEKIDDLKEVGFFYLDSIFIPFDTFEKVVSIYVNTIKGATDVKVGLDQMKELGLKFDNSFMDIDTHYEVD